MPMNARVMGSGVCYTAAGSPPPDMSNSPSFLRQFASAVRPYFSRRYLRHWLALAAAIVLVWLAWPFAPLIGHLAAVRALIQLGPGLAGIDRPKTNLNLVENEDEPPAPGGDTTAAGKVPRQHGRTTH